MNKNTIWIALITIATMGTSAAWAGDVKKGADVFAEECGDCHSLTPGKNKKGPTLNGVFGRKSGSIGEFSGYSDAMRQAGIIWTPEKVDAYITQPRKVVPGGKMKYDGLDDAGARSNVIAYLMSIK